MKWFKHFSDSSDDEFLVELEEIFGLEGYARWFKLLEAIAAQMDSRKDASKCSATYSWKKWQTILKGKRKKLEIFLNHCQNKSKIKLEQNENILKITCPKLIEIKDNYQKDLEASSKKLPSKEAEGEVEEEVDVEVEREKTYIRPKKTKTDRKKPKYDADDEAFVERMIADISSWSGSFKTPSVGVWAEEIRKMRQIDKVPLDEIHQTWKAIQADTLIHNQGAGWKGWRSVILSASKFREKYHKARVGLNLDNPITAQQRKAGNSKPVFVPA